MGHWDVKGRRVYTVNGLTEMIVTQVERMLCTDDVETFINDNYTAWQAVGLAQDEGWTYRRFKHECARTIFENDMAVPHEGEDYRFEGFEAVWRECD